MQRYLPCVCIYKAMEVILPLRVIPESFAYLITGALEAFADHFSQIGNHE
jgi:hypothetical protein